ncbi:MAG: conjugal transfer protein TraF [Nitrospirota bacterium]
MRSVVLGIVVLIAMAQLASAQSGVFFDRSRDGWFWYLEHRSVPPPKKPAQTPLPPTVKAMRERAEELLARAIEEPTEARVVAYMAFQQQLTQRSEQFARVWQRVLWQHPELDPTVTEPVTAAALSPVQADRVRRQDAALSDLARTAGLFYFFSRHCPLCEVQSPILAAFAAAYGFRVIAVSLDGAPDPVFEQAKVDDGAAEKLGVTQVPAVFLARPPSDVLRVGTGLLTMEELSRRIVRLSEANEEMNEEDIDDTLAAMDDGRGTLGASVEHASLGRSAAATE